ncbi:MAG TPA: S8 family peptidase, partial [Roseiflexaceae bacterium]|nr:S8 family peptidase [Roseiflexaceae bacterium]
MVGPAARSSAILALLLGVLLLSQATAPPATPAGAGAAYIVQAASAADAERAVRMAGGIVGRRLAIIGGVSAVLPPTALARLRVNPALRLHPDAPVRAALGQLNSPPTEHENDTAGYLLYPSAAVGAAPLHQVALATRTDTCSGQQLVPGGGTAQLPLQGWGVTVAVIDSGFMRLQNRQGTQSGWDFYDATTGTLYVEGDAAGGISRCILYRDFLPRSDANENTGPQNGRNSTDQNGHGTHVISSIADNRAVALSAALSGPAGVAPKVNLVIARALDAAGAGSYAGVIDAIQWVLENRARYNIRVLNLSIYAQPYGPYWADPLNEAVMRAWQAGLVVVTAAGNSGPEPGTITAPGNVPYVISVGAVRSGRYSASGADELAPYSSRGPTESGFVKPDVVVPASRTIAPVPDDSTSALAIPEARIQEKANVDFAIGAPDKQHTYYQLSGTSMAAAQVTGIVALMLQANPGMTNEQVKYRLLATARAALDESGRPLYSVWEQGAGMVDARQAVLCDASPAEACAPGVANAGMDIGLDLDTETHYWGYTEWADPPGEFQLVDPDGQVLQVWNGAGRIWAGAGRIWAGA